MSEVELSFTPLIFGQFFVDFLFRSNPFSVNIDLSSRHVVRLQNILQIAFLSHQKRVRILSQIPNSAEIALFSTTIFVALFPFPFQLGVFSRSKFSYLLNCQPYQSIRTLSIMMNMKKLSALGFEPRAIETRQSCLRLALHKKVVNIPRNRLDSE